MNGKTLKIYPVSGDENTGTSETSIPAVNPPYSIRDLGLSMIPFMPVPFTGEKSAFAYLRLGIYGTLAIMTWEKYRRLSYACIGATAVSAVTSFSAVAWNGKK